jgi:hypothetical protein
MIEAPTVTKKSGIDITLDTSSGEGLWCNIPFSDGVLLPSTNSGRCNVSWNAARKRRQTGTTRRLLLRGDQLDIEEFVRQTPKAYIHGPPGCGKTTAVLVAVLTKLYVDKACRICWVNFSHLTVTLMETSIHRSENTTLVPTRIDLKLDVSEFYFSGEVGDLSSQMTSNIPWRENAAVRPYLVFDGLTKTSSITHERVLDRMLSPVFPHGWKQSVIVSSFGVDISRFSSYTGKALGVWSIDMYRYLLKDPALYDECKGNLGYTDHRYELAKADTKAENPLADDAFIAKAASDNLRRELIDEKFDVAGASCRWMLEHTSAEVLDDIRECIRMARDNGHISWKNDVFVNTLVYVSEEEYFPMSETVVRELAWWVSKAGDDASWLRTFMSMSCSPTLRGWLLEAKFLHYCVKLDVASRLEDYRLLGGTAALWPLANPKRVVSFGGTSSLGRDPDVTVENVCVGTLFIPRIFSQAGFDAVEYVQLNPHQYFNGTCAEYNVYWKQKYNSLSWGFCDDVIDWPDDSSVVSVLRFIQVPRAQARPLKFRRMRSFANYLSSVLAVDIGFIEIVMVRSTEEKTSQNAFSWSVPVGMPPEENLQPYERRIAVTEVFLNDRL